MVLATRVLWILGLMLLSGFLLTGCGDNTATSTSVPAATPAITTAAATSGVTTTTSAAAGTNAADVQAGLQIFTQNCQSCHLKGGTVAGTGPRLAGERGIANTNRVQRQIRNGGDGMPAFSSSQISDADLSKLIAYLKALQ